MAMGRSGGVVGPQGGWRMAGAALRIGRDGRGWCFSSAWAWPGADGSLEGQSSSEVVEWKASVIGGDVLAIGGRVAQTRVQRRGSEQRRRGDGIGEGETAVLATRDVRNKWQGGCRGRVSQAMAAPNNRKKSA